MTRLISILLSLCPLLVLAQEDLMSYDNILKFARYLKSSQQYEFASQEYERIHYLLPKDTAVIKELVQTYRLGHKCHKMDKSYEILAENNRIFEHHDFSAEYLKFSLTCNDFSDKYNLLLSQLPDHDKSFYELSKLWVSKDYNGLQLWTSQHKDINLSYPYDELVTVTKDFTHIKYKSPGLAVLMSAVLPGSGKAYVNRWGDALMSFLFVATNAYASYRAFSKKGIQSANGWIFGGLAVSFYTANVWGSHRAVKKYNQKLRIQYQKNAETIIYSTF
ncbi:MAG: hypothetical protein CR968_00735 [Flavobacteriia bacterium]|nr:MAG: hypothetical protein CR968_00735 [Flavobacteriia bacterium]